MARTMVKRCSKVSTDERYVSKEVGFCLRIRSVNKRLVASYVLWTCQRKPNYLLASDLFHDIKYFGFTTWHVQAAGWPRRHASGTHKIQYCTIVRTGSSTKASVYTLYVVD
jgi:hypothetical protein